MLRFVALLCVAACGGKPAAPAPTAKPVEPASKPTIGPGEETSLSPAMVLEQIQSKHLTAIKRCYKRHLNTDPEAKGKVQLAFTVLDTGAIEKPSATGFATEVDTCIAALMPAWQFPIPLDPDGNKTTAEFKITLQLIPD